MWTPILHMLRLINIYATSFPGSSLWRINSESVNRIYTTWNINIRQLFKLPYNTHRYLIEPISGCRHLKTILCSRFINFYSKLLSNHRFCIRFLVNICTNDASTIVGGNLAYLQKDCNVSKQDLDRYVVKEKCIYHHAPDEFRWKIPLILELLDVRNNLLSVPPFESNEITDMLYALCSS